LEKKKKKKEHCTAQFALCYIRSSGGGEGRLSAPNPPRNVPRAGLPWNCSSEQVVYFFRCWQQRSRPLLPAATGH
jgi:hypothetical protein